LELARVGTRFENIMCPKNVIYYQINKHFIGQLEFSTFRKKLLEITNTTKVPAYPL